MVLWGGASNGMGGASGMEEGSRNNGCVRI